MKKALPFIVIVLLLVVAVSVVGALPGSGWKSGQQVQNVGGANAQVVLTAYDQGGTSFNCGTESVASGASVTYLTDVDCPVPAGFLGSAVVSADQPIAAIVNVNNKGTGLAAGQYQGTDGADVATTIVFPLVKNNHNGRTTTFYVQNASNSANDITATFNVLGNTYTKTYTGVAANAMVIVSPTDTTPAMPSGSGTVGSLTVVGTQPLAGSSLEHETNVPVGENLQASKSFTAADGATEVYCPLYRKNHTVRNQTTGAQVQNVSNSAVDVEFTFNSNMGTFGPFNANIAPGASYTFFAGTLPGIPNGALGSATIASTGPVVAVVNDKGVDNGVTRVTTYACFGSGGTSVNVPLAKEFAGGNTTGVQVQNIGGAGTQVTLEYKATNGNALTVMSKGSVAPGTSITSWGISNYPNAEWDVVSGNPAAMIGTVNGVVVSGSSDLAVIANESSTNAHGAPSNQDTKNYEGFN
jgi:hypothetical protein